MRHLLRISILSIILSSIFLVDTFTLSARFDQAAFNAYALQYGNKAANLHELSNIAQDIQAPIPIEVPAFFAVSNQSAIDFLKNVPGGGQSVYADLMSDWQEFKKAQSGSLKVLREEAKKVLTQIRDRILRAFENKQFTLSSDQQKQLNEFLSKASGQDQRQMVRSTGREDTQELANAGGNESIASVDPDIQSVSRAMGRVIASYFSEQSIGQRIAAGDKQLFDDPFMPVLLQVMIGEKPGGSKVIPVSGVMFSQEAEGRTPDVAQIQATYGQGEGVVNGLVPVDTFYVGPSQTIYGLIAIKGNRIITAADGKSSKTQENPRELQRIPALSKAEVESLKITAEAVQKYYGYPVDIEFVVQNKKIYLVQARPLQEPKSTPSYISTPYFGKLKADQKYPVFVIGAAGGKARIITDAKQIIIADNIRIALKEFLSREDKEQIEAVVVGEMAPATSHEATNFRANGKPVVYTTNVGSIKSLIDGGSLPLILDTQRGVLVHFEPQGTFESSESAIEENAWFAHPIPPHASVFKVLYTPLTEDQVRLIAPKLILPEKTIAELFELLKEGDSEQVINASRTLLAHVATRIAQEKKTQAELKQAKKQTNPQLIEQLELVSKYIARAVYDLMYQMDIWQKSSKTTQDRLIRLYPVGFIEAFIKQIPQPKMYVNDYSLGSLLKTENIEQQLVGELGLSGNKLRAFIAQYAKAQEYALTDDVKQAWLKFLKHDLGGVDARLNGQFAQLIHSLATFNVLPLWLNSIFYHAAQKYDNPTELTQSLVQDYTGDAAFIGKLTLLNKKLTTFDSAVFESSDRFDQQWKNLQTEFYDYFISNEFLTSFHEAQVLAKTIALSVMNQFVTVFDTSIKALTGSTAYGNSEQKVSRFKSMLERYALLMRWWGGLIDAVAMRQALSRSFASFEAYCEKIDSILKEIAPLTAHQLNASGSFNVIAALLGSKATFNYTGAMPTLEDMFTLIHQNLLISLSMLSNQWVPAIPVPPLVGAVLEAVEKVEAVLVLGHIEKINKIGVDFNYPQLIYRFNLAMGDHSSISQVVYDTRNKKMYFQAQLFGINPVEPRWGRIYVVLNVLAQLGGIELVRPVILEDELVEFALYIKNAQQAQKMMQLYQLFAEVSTRYHPRFSDNVLQVVFGNVEKARQFNELLLQEVPKHPRWFTMLFHLLSYSAFNFAQEKNVDLVLSQVGEEKGDLMKSRLMYALEAANKIVLQAQSLSGQRVYDLILYVVDATKYRGPQVMYDFSKWRDGTSLLADRAFGIMVDFDKSELMFRAVLSKESFSDVADAKKAFMLMKLMIELAGLQPINMIKDTIYVLIKNDEQARIITDLYWLIEEKIIGKKNEESIVQAALQSAFGNVEKLDAFIDLLMKEIPQDAYALFNEILYAKKYNYADQKVKTYLEHVLVWFEGLTEKDAGVAQSFKKVVEAVNREHPLPKEFMEPLNRL